MTHLRLVSPLAEPVIEPPADQYVDPVPAPTCRDVRFCLRCGDRTYPTAWCRCYPAQQVSDYFREECVILMPDDERELADLSP